MMDGFHVIQNFFTRMQCNHCTHYLQPEGVELIRHDRGVYVVNVHCTSCTRQMGIALVGLEGAELTDEARRVYEDPELTESELMRLEGYEAIDYDDVIEAHNFFKNLGSDWQKYLPPEMSEFEIEPEWESEAEAS